MARTKNTARAPRTARSAAHAAPDPAPAPGTSPVPGSAAAAVHAALTANPGATTAAIATAAGISRPAARDALAAMEAAGEATRTKGGKPGIPDTWTLAAPGPSGTGPAGPGHDDGHAVTSRPGDDPADAEQDASARQKEASGAPARADGDLGQAAQPDGDPAKRRPCRGQPGDGSPAGEDTAASHEQDRRAASPDGSSVPAGTPPDPALVTEIAGHIGQIQAAASAAATALADGGDLRAVRAGLDEIYEQAAQARRAAQGRRRREEGPGRPAGRAAREGPRPPARPPGRQLHPARDPQGDRPLLRGDRQRPGHPGQARRRRAGHREAPPVPPRRHRRARRAQPPAEPGPRARAQVTDGSGGCRMTTRADGRGGSTPPRPAAPDSAPGQWFVFKPWVYDVDAAIGLLRAAPRPPQPLPVMAWARAYGLIRDPGSEPHAVSLIGPGPGFDPGYAMTTDLDDPVIIATITTADGEPAGPLLIDGCHRLYKAAGSAASTCPSLVLTAAEILSIRRHGSMPSAPARGEPAGTETRR